MLRSEKGFDKSLQKWTNKIQWFFSEFSQGVLWMISIRVRVWVLCGCSLAKARDTSEVLPSHLPFHFRAGRPSTYCHSPKRNLAYEINCEKTSSGWPINGMLSKTSLRASKLLQFETATQQLTHWLTTSIAKQKQKSWNIYPPTSTSSSGMPCSERKNYGLFCILGS